jgi:hypothetical protein
MKMGKAQKLVRAILDRTKNLHVPKHRNSAVRIGLGILNFLLPGVGTIIAGVIFKILEDDSIYVNENILASPVFNIH